MSDTRLEHSKQHLLHPTSVNKGENGLGQGRDATYTFHVLGSFVFPECITGPEKEGNLLTVTQKEGSGLWALGPGEHSLAEAWMLCVLSGNTHIHTQEQLGRWDSAGFVTRHCSQITEAAAT